MASREESRSLITRFRPCIDLHGGKVKQIVGSTLTAASENGDNSAASSIDAVQENFVTDSPPSFFGELYMRDALPGGHVIMLGPGNEEAAMEALRSYPGGFHVGGGITPDNASRFLDAGASHVIVTSYVFRDGDLCWDNLGKMVNAVGKDRLVLDLSCRRKAPDSGYFVVTDRWQKFTSLEVNSETLTMLAEHCAEFLVHGVDVEGLRCGMLDDLIALLAQHSPLPVTYAGGASSLQDLDRVKSIGLGKVHLTIGSALDIFGGDVAYGSVVAWQRSEEASAA